MTVSPGPNSGSLRVICWASNCWRMFIHTHRSWVDYTQMLSRIGPHLTSFLYLLDIQVKVFCLPLTVQHRPKAPDDAARCVPAPVFAASGGSPRGRRSSAPP